MTDRLSMDSNELRRLADGHITAAERTRHWARRPEEWLAGFPVRYGSIAYPVYRGLIRFYDRRERAGNEMAAQHERAAERLRAAADAFDRVDSEGADKLRDSRTGLDQPISTPPEVHPGAVSPYKPVQSAAPESARPTAAPLPTARAQPVAPQAPVPSVVTGPLGAGPTPTGKARHVGLANSGVQQLVTGNSARNPMGEPIGGTAPLRRTLIAVDQERGAAGSGGKNGLGAAPSLPIGLRRPEGRSAGSLATASPPPGGEAASKVSIPPTVPSDCSRTTAQDGLSQCDLLVARRLLSAILTAPEMAFCCVSCATAVLRGPVGAALFVTTNDGRGWLPAGVFLPHEVSTPWQWIDILGDGVAELSLAWEGYSDPSRIMMEFGRAWESETGAALSALASSDPIDPVLQMQLHEVAVEGCVAPGHDLDLRRPATGAVDRLGLTGSIDALDQVAAVPAAKRQSHCVGLVADAHQRLLRMGPTPRDAVDSAHLRNRIIASLEFGHQPPREWWEELRKADDAVTTAIRLCRADVVEVRRGGPVRSRGADRLRALVFQRRCTEMVWLLAGRPGWQQLRDVVYAYEQIVKHPAFKDVPSVMPVRYGSSPANSAGGINVSMPTALSR